MTEEEYNEGLQRQFDARSKEPLLTDSVSLQIIQRLNEIAKLIPQHRFYRPTDFGKPTLAGLAEIGANGMRCGGDVAFACSYLTSALIALDGDMDGPAAGTG